MGTKVTVNCANGYQPVGGHSVVSCDSQGHWMPNSPDCAVVPASANIGAEVGGAIAGVVLILAAIVITAIVVWKLAMYIGRKRGFGPVSIHVEDENVNLFPDDDDEHLDFHDKDDEPLYRPGSDDDVAPLDLGETKSS